MAARVALEPSRTGPRAQKNTGMDGCTSRGISSMQPRPGTRIRCSEKRSNVGGKPLCLCPPTAQEAASDSKLNKQQLFYT
jgi:hypothetical protein